jgi:hypothetical protein
MSAVDAAEAEHVQPAFAKEQLRRFSFLDLEAIPGNGRITRMYDAAEVGDLARFSPSCERGHGCEDQEQRENYEGWHVYSPCSDLSRIDVNKTGTRIVTDSSQLQGDSRMPDLVEGDAGDDDVNSLADTVEAVFSYMSVILQQK